ncbi:MBL fold metallo-hydrolase [Mucilaginibacter sp. X4EP1]|uniref:MBL fold metallo-hydrolase n=1 Tax=Mucilaginibacter sp. X4EP1 TaxID=2723092 RepID=UPI0021689889|nr:MBL fold metallo-hydrolase [Mucilaginibacter sp. X4EP1]MCS3811560.1 L-ascorbate metabolism protein UlaG (beta-lactamase superfamily) [Mucilaginibacter sp. X4EP1]
MKRKEFIEKTLIAATVPLLSPLLSHAQTSKSHQKMKNECRLLRNATLVLKINGLTILVDPMLSPKDAMDTIQNAANNKRIPMVELPVSENELNGILKKLDAVLITHTHRDHWDVAAQTLIDKQLQIFCQPADTEKIKSQGFVNVTQITDEVNFRGISISRTGGHHGTGEIEEMMGEVSGFVLKDQQETVYIAGDTIWCQEVKDALVKYQPQLIVVNSGAPRFLTGGPITMTAADVIHVHQERPGARVVAVHLEAVNHCTINRADLKNALAAAGIGKDKVLVPDDGATF